MTLRLAALGEALRRALGPLNPAAAAGRAGPPQCATVRIVRSSASGVTLTESIPQPTRNSATSGWSDGAWPQIPQWRPLRRAPSTAWRRNASTAGSCSSKSNAIAALSRSTPSVSRVRSFEPIEKPSKRLANSSTRMTSSRESRTWRGSRAGEGVELAALVARDLGDDVGGRAEAVDAEPRGRPAMTSER